MVKEPRPGRVKTRLGRDIGLIDATWWYRHQTRNLLRRIRDPRWSLLLAVAPDVAGLASRVWPRDVPRIPQGTGDLGARMARALAQTRGPSLLIGSDIPAVNKHHIARAFRSIPTAGSVIGPATDGGYWLVGLAHPNRPYSKLFKDVRWSTSHTLSDTQETLPKPVVLVDPLADIDTAADLHLFQNTQSRRA
ncbi:MAG: TIGR04282 family arsenosugar biosynthesis glycosyltransferase [Paracoccaceae bacterium]